jgi:hypothetical protein
MACGVEGPHELPLFRLLSAGNMLKLVTHSQLRLPTHSGCGNPPPSHPQNQSGPIQYP